MFYAGVESQFVVGVRGFALSRQPNHQPFKHLAVHYAIYTLLSTSSSCSLLTEIPASPDLTLLSLTLECETFRGRRANQPSSCFIIAITTTTAVRHQHNVGDRRHTATIRCCGWNRKMSLIWYHILINYFGATSNIAFLGVIYSHHGTLLICCILTYLFEMKWWMGEWPC